MNPKDTIEKKRKKSLRQVKQKWQKEKKGNKKIKRESFFDLPMFEFCAFKSLLPNVFNINFEKENVVKDLLGEKKNLHSINNIKDFNVDPNNKFKNKGKIIYY